MKPEKRKAPRFSELIKVIHKEANSYEEYKIKTMEKIETYLDEIGPAEIVDVSKTLEGDGKEMKLTIEVVIVKRQEVNE